MENRFKFVDIDGKLFFQCESTNSKDAEKELEALGILVDLKIDEDNKRLILLPPEDYLEDIEKFEISRMNLLFEMLPEASYDEELRKKYIQQ